MGGQIQEDGVSPRAAFHFRAMLFDGVAVLFQEMTAPDGGAQVMENRHGDGPVVRPRQTREPGAVGGVTLRRGVFANDSRFREWYGGIRTNSLPRGTVTIELLDEAGAPRMTWRLERARPVGITGADLAAEGGEVAVESLEIAYETMVITP